MRRWKGTSREARLKAEREREEEREMAQPFLCLDGTNTNSLEGKYHIDC